MQCLEASLAKQDARSNSTQQKCIRQTTEFVNGKIIHRGFVLFKNDWGGTMPTFYSNGTLF